MTRLLLFLCLLGGFSASQAQSQRMTHGDALSWLVMADRLEFVDADGTDALQWEGQAWIGGDYHKLMLKTEGEYDMDSDTAEEVELHLLYSRAVSPFWDVQAGLRHDEGEAPSSDYLAFGLQGLAPYWFEIDTAAFVSESGKLSARLEAEYDLQFTQRLILQPRLELNYAFSADEDAGVAQGMNEASAGLRLRYEFRREIAPYVGLEWWKAYGDTGAALASAGLARSDTRLVAGFRLWY